MAPVQFLFSGPQLNLRQKESHVNILLHQPIGQIAFTRNQHPIETSTLIYKLDVESELPLLLSCSHRGQLGEISLRIDHSFRQIIKARCKEQFLQKLESCSSPLGSSSTHFCSGSKGLSSLCTGAEMDNTVFPKSEKC